MKEMGKYGTMVSKNLECGQSNHSSFIKPSYDLEPFFSLLTAKCSGKISCQISVKKYFYLGIGPPSEPDINKFT